MNTTMSTTEERLQTLELKLMDLENSVSELNEVIITQYREIDQLKSAQTRLTGQIETLQQSESVSDNEPPPHY